MTDTMQRIPYFYTEVADKPGEGAKVLNMLRDERVNLVSFLGFPKGRRAQLDLIPEDQAALKAACKKAKLKLVGPKTAFLIQGDDRLGAGAEIMDKLAGINVTASCAVAAGAGRFGTVIWVKPRDVNKAAKALGIGSPTPQTSGLSLRA